MDSQHLKEFITFSESLNYRTAAKELYIANTTLSAHISALEAEIGVPLVAKRSSGFCLTVAGKVFLQHAQRILDEIERVAEECREEASRHISLRIGTFESGAIEPKFWEAGLKFHWKHPDRRVEVTTVPTIECGITALEKYDLDISFYHAFHFDETTEDPNLDAPYRTTYFCSIKAYFVVMKGHPLFDKEVLHLEDLNGAQLLLTTPRGKHSFREKLTELLRNEEMEINVRILQPENYHEYLFYPDPTQIRVISEHSISDYNLSRNPLLKYFEIQGYPAQDDLYLVYNDETFPDLARPLLEELAGETNSNATS